MFLARKLKTWSEYQLISTGQAEAILAFEKKAGHARISFGIGGLGVLSIILGVISLVAANWDIIPPETKIGLHVVLNLILGGVIWRFSDKLSWGTEVLVSLQAGFILSFLALIGQVLHTQSPLWVPLGAWLVLATPMLLSYTRFTGIVAVWLGALGIFSVSFAMNELSEIQTRIFLAGMPFVPFLLFNLKGTRNRLPQWGRAVEKLFLLGVIAGTSFAQILWHVSPYHQEVPTASLVTVGLGVLVVFFLNVMQRKGFISFWNAYSPAWEAFILISYGFALLPLLVPHGELPVVGAVMFCLYWLFLGGVGLRTGIPRLWSLAMLFVGARLFVAYVEIFGSLALQGIGFIFTGLLFLLFAWATRKLMQSKPQWLSLETNDQGKVL